MLQEYNDRIHLLRPESTLDASSEALSLGFERLSIDNAIGVHSGVRVLGSFGVELWLVFQCRTDFSDLQHIADIKQLKQ